MHSNRGLYCLRIIHRVNIIAWPNLTCYLLHGLIARPNLRNYIHQIASTCNYIHQVSPVMGWGELGVAHPGALRPQKLPVELKILFQYKSKNAGPTLFVFMFVARRWQSPEQDPTLPKRLIDMDMFLYLYFTILPWSCLRPCEFLAVLRPT